MYFVYPTNRGYVTPTPVVRFGLIGMGVAPAGFEKVNTGHHHLLVDTELPAFDQPIPSDFNHLHFGAGQTEAKITLPMGKHTLQLLLADENHVPHDPPIFSEQISVTVNASGRPPGEAVSQASTLVLEERATGAWHENISADLDCSSVRFCAAGLFDQRCEG